MKQGDAELLKERRTPNAKLHRKNVSRDGRHCTVRDGILADCAADIVKAYVGRGRVSADELVAVICTVRETLESLTRPIAKAVSLRPAVPITASITPDYLICLEDGKPLRTLKRYLMRRYGLTPKEYRERWGLSGSYPMIAPSYKQERKDMAIRTGLGKKPDSTDVAIASMDDDQKNGS